MYIFPSRRVEIIIDFVTRVLSIICWTAFRTVPSPSSVVTGIERQDDTHQINVQVYSVSAPTLLVVDKECICT